MDIIFWFILLYACTTVVLNELEKATDLYNIYCRFTYLFSNI